MENLQKLNKKLRKLRQANFDTHYPDGTEWKFYALVDLLEQVEKVIEEEEYLYMDSE